MHLPLVQVEGTKATFRIGVAGRDSFGLFPRLGPYHIDSHLSIPRRTAQEDLSCLVLPLHPGQMLVQRYGPFLSWPNRPTVYKVPHGSLPFLGDSHTLSPKQIPFCSRKFHRHVRFYLIGTSMSTAMGGLQLGILSLIVSSLVCPCFFLSAILESFGSIQQAPFIRTLSIAVESWITQSGKR